MEVCNIIFRNQKIIGVTLDSFTHHIAINDDRNLRWLRASPITSFTEWLENDVKQTKYTVIHGVNYYKTKDRLNVCKVLSVQHDSVYKVIGVYENFGQVNNIINDYISSLEEQIKPNDMHHIHDENVKIYYN